MLGKIHNPNEHLNSRVWRYCSKYKNANKNRLDLAIARATVDYKVGYVKGYLCDELKFLISKITMFHLL